MNFSLKSLLKIIAIIIAALLEHDCEPDKPSA
jgi:hypothetical protein